MPIKGIQTELEKLKSEMLKKIEDIHDLEQELVKIEGLLITSFKLFCKFIMTLFLNINR